MSKYAIAAFLLLYGALALLKLDIPTWVLGLVALAAGLIVLVDGISLARRP